MTGHGLLCPIGRNLYLAWLSSSPQVVSNSTEILPKEILDAISNRTDEYRQALDAYKAHRAACLACKEKG